MAIVSQMPGWTSETLAVLEISQPFFLLLMSSYIKIIRQIPDTNTQQNTNHILVGDITLLPTESFNSFSPATED